MADQFKTPIGLADDLIRQARRNTLNKRINYKGNYENYINGGSHALNNQVHLDSNEYAQAMNDSNSGWSKDEWLGELNDRYTNPEHNRIAGDSPVGSGKKYIHRYTPSTKRGRRLSDIFFESGRHGVAKSPFDLEEFQEKVIKYEGR